MNENSSSTEVHDTPVIPVIQAGEAAEPELDEAGYFVISIHPEKMTILARHYSYDKELLRVIEGRDARSIYRTIIKYRWASTLKHAAYLGQELTRTEMAMKAGSVYIQG
ncbi:MAG: hypothetical protein JW705_09040 [Methanosarcinaceae archaeon]|nr:hypothetical protein [Methanosarcinaceae archaeon]